MVEDDVHKSESFNSVTESQKSDSEIVRPKSLASLDKTDNEACRSPGNGTVPVNIAVVMGSTNFTKQKEISITPVTFVTNVSGYSILPNTANKLTSETYES